TVGQQTIDDLLDAPDAATAPDTVDEPAAAASLDEDGSGTGARFAGTDTFSLLGWSMWDEDSVLEALRESGSVDDVRNDRSYMIEGMDLDGDDGFPPSFRAVVRDLATGDVDEREFPTLREAREHLDRRANEHE